MTLPVPCIPPLSTLERKAAGCEGKFAYATRTLAELAIAAVSRRNKRRKGRRLSGLHPYRCEFCDHWHIGNRKP